MHGIYKLKEMLCAELEEYGEKGELKSTDLHTVDTLAHTVKNLDRIIEDGEKDGYSERGRSYRSYDGGSYRRSYDGGSYDGGGAYDDGNSYESYYRRGRDSMGRYTDDGRSMRRGMYSRGEGREKMIRDLEGLKGEMSDNARERVDKLIAELQNE